eukprot:PITA_09156
MACVENVNYSVIINGIPSTFFYSREGTPSGLSSLPIALYSGYEVSQLADQQGSIRAKMQKFQSASRILINKEKPKLYHNDANMELVLWIVAMIGINQASIGNGIKYLGFNLKAKGNKKRDWLWLVDRFYNRISSWEARLLSLAGRFILVQAVLSQLAI